MTERTWALHLTAFEVAALSGMVRGLDDHGIRAGNIVEKLTGLKDDVVSDLVNLPPLGSLTDDDAYEDSNVIHPETFYDRD